MKSTLFALASLLIGGAAMATPVPEVPYDKMMVLTPGLEHLGYSRLVTVEACEGETGSDHTALMTDSEFENFERCLVSYN